MDKVQQAFSIYIQSLVPHIWFFEYEEGLVAELQFKEEDFPHMLGLDKLQKYALMKSKQMRGIASVCLSDLKNGSITDDLIKKDRSRRLIERRVSNFENLPILLDDPATQHFIFDKALVPCSINAEYMLYNPLNNTHCYFGTVETRLTKGSTPKKYSPITWFIEEDRPDMYIKGQKSVILKSISKQAKQVQAQ